MPLQTAEPALAHIDIGVLDALVLLASRRVPLAVERAEPPGVPHKDPGHLDAGDGCGAVSAGIDWDEALRLLLGD